MARSYVFLVHGVAVHDAKGWSQRCCDALIAALRLYAPFNSKSAAEIEANYLHFVPISYEGILESYRKRWHNLEGALADHGVLAQKDLHDAFSWVAEQDDELKHVFWIHVLDMVLWLSLPHARAAAQSRAAMQLVEGLEQMVRENGTGAHVIAHGLGTSVLHDALVGLCAIKSEPRGALSPAQLRCKSITMVANTSRLLRARKEMDATSDLSVYRPYTSVVRPETTGVTDAYLNVHHQIDPFTWPKRFAPVGWPLQRYNDLMVTHFSEPARAHDLEHYLANPQVHIPLLRTLVDKRTLGSTSEIERAWKAFIARHPHTHSTPFDELKSLFEDQSDKRLSTRELTEYLTRAFAALHGNHGAPPP